MLAPTVVVLLSIALTIGFSSPLYKEKPSDGELYLVATMAPLLLVFSFCFRCLGKAWNIVPALVYGAALSFLIDLDGKTGNMSDDERQSHKVMVISYPFFLFFTVAHMGWTCCFKTQDES